MNALGKTVETISRAADPVTALRDLVLAQDGHWTTPPPDIPGLFEIQFCGVTGIGPSSAAAVDDWMIQARTQVAREGLRVA